MLFYDFYENDIELGIVDLDNVLGGGFVGVIIVVLFLCWFVDKFYIYFDCYGWNCSLVFVMLKGGIGQGICVLLDVLLMLLVK